MTTFDLIVLLITILIVVILLFFGVVWKLLDDIKEWQKSICDKLGSIRSDTVDIFQELNNIEDNILDENVGLPVICKKLDDLRIVAPELQGVLNDLAINSKGHYNELQQLREEIYSKRLLLGLDAKSFPPCYAPNGICTNPQMDCIDCPKRGTGCSWSTNTQIKAEDAPLQSFFNDNKED